MNHMPEDPEDSSREPPQRRAEPSLFGAENSLSSGDDPTIPPSQESSVPRPPLPFAVSRAASASNANVRTLRARDLQSTEPPTVLLPLLLFALTCVSTFFAGATNWEPAIAFESAMRARQLVLRHGDQGLLYMISVVSILLAHEMGHYIGTRIYRIQASLPFFIPFPIAPIGTMGAVIAMRGQQANRREIFDIGIAGPLAGLVLAIPITWYGVAQLELPESTATGQFQYDMPLLVRGMYAMTHPGEPGITELYASQFNAPFMAGWVGLLITGLNMLPISQLDGGHVVYTLFGRKSRWINRMFVVTAIAYMVWAQVLVWWLMLFLVMLIGIYHPPTSNDAVPLGRFRLALGWLSLLIPILCFPPRGLILAVP